MGEARPCCCWLCRPRSCTRLASGRRGFAEEEEEEEPGGSANARAARRQRKGPGTMRAVELARRRGRRLWMRWTVCRRDGPSTSWRAMQGGILRWSWSCSRRCSLLARRAPSRIRLPTSSSRRPGRGIRLVWRWVGERAPPTREPLGWLRRVHSCVPCCPSFAPFPCTIGESRCRLEAWECRCCPSLLSVGLCAPPTKWSWIGSASRS